MTVADDGSVQATCLFQTGTTVCQGVSPPVNQQVPAVTLSVTGLTQDSQGRFEVNAGQQVAVTRAITNSADVCIASATPASGASGWLNVFAPAASSVANVQFSGSGEVTLGLRCYNQAGAAPTATQLRFVVAAAVGVNPDLCELPPDPLIRPQGFTRYVLTWNDLFRVGPFPNAPGYLNPVGSYTIGRSFPGASAAAMYITVPIVPEPGKTYVFNHATAQAVAAAGYFGDPSRAGGNFMSISPCAGDVRPIAPGSPDQLLRVCRSALLYEDVFRFTTLASAPASACKVTPGQTYWLTFMMNNPATLLNGGELNLTQTACDGGRQYCETMIQVSVLSTP
ncbi:MAG: hypothetical protein ABS96_26855 [Lysobacteraceae bacterium SCN 69-123]|nr:MAG: hypothetical protein ABS96_26855 [Xanthomonadaceae bacterium SCN 69-123]